MNSQCKLAEKTCVPCRSNTPPLKGKELQQLFHQLESGWKVIEEHHLEKKYTFKDFKEALAFTNKVAALAEEEGHHPDLLLSYGKVVVQLWTHKIEGLSESDFILAAKCDHLG